MAQSDRLKFQFRIDRDKWEEYKGYVPRSKTLEESIRELVLEDLAEAKDNE